MPITAKLRTRAGRDWGWFVAWLAVLPIVVLRAGTFTEWDTFWQIRTGLLVVTSGSIPSRDTLSWTATGTPWTLNSWAFDVLVGIGYDIGGLPVVALLCAAFGASVVGMLLVLARRAGASVFVAGAVVWFATALLVGFLSARPQLMDYVGVLLVVLILNNVKAGRSTLAWVSAMGIATALWENIHAGAPLGVAIAATATVAVATRACSRPAWPRLALAAVAAAAALLANPYGVGLLTHASRVFDSSRRLVAEWQPTDFRDPLQLSLFGLGLAGLGLALAERDEIFAAALAVCAAGSVTAMRILPMFALLAVPMVAKGLSGPVVMRYVISRRVMLQRGAAVAVTGMSVLSLAACTHLGRPDPGLYPAALPSRIPIGCRTYTTPVLGSYLMLVRPDVSVSLDGRNDVFGTAAYAAETAAVAGRASADPVLTGAGCVLVPSASGLAKALAGDGEWDRVAAEPTAVLFVRRLRFCPPASCS